MATRLGLRPCDIVPLTFSDLDFQAEAIRIVQEKTDTPLELPMLPVIHDAFRSSLARSIVYDGVTYEAARQTLGHRDQNAIRHYAKLDVEQLRLYALEPPAATGHFAEIFSGRCTVK